ncbi:MAG: glutaminyl-peptide cyclotransferase [Sphingobacterium hotanense]
MKLKLRYLGIVLALPFLFIYSCKTQKGKFEFVNPKSGSKVLTGVKLQLKLNFNDIVIDSVVYSVDGDIFDRKTDTTAVIFDTEKHGYGSKSLSAKIYAQGKEEIAYCDLMVTPPAPKAYAFEVINTFPHDSQAFTQGLYYDNGILYESTGKEDRTSLRKVDLKTGKVIQKIDGDGTFFGEGMTVVADKIYFLTWLNKKGFIYDKVSLELISSFDYGKSTEGWGLTYDGKQFIKSDGSANIYFLDPLSLQETGSVQVFDNNGPVDRINELEYVDGKLFANIYDQSKDEVVIIDPVTGVIEGRINFVGLYDGVRKSADNEMNGIAYKPDTETFLLTGKDWTKLFEVRLEIRK